MAESLSSFCVVAKHVTQHNTLVKVIETAFGPDSVDCCFKFHDISSNAFKEIKAHRKVLAALSSVFATTFNGNWDNNPNPIIIVDASFEDFETFVTYFYKATIQLTSRNVNQILRLAHKYDVNDLMVRCSAFAIEQLRIATTVPWYTIAIAYDLNNLKQKCTEILTNNTEHVFMTSAFSSCDRNILKHILKLEKMSCKEHMVFDTCIEWAKIKCRKKNIDESKPENLRGVLGDCFELIRFKEMERDEFMKRFDLLKTMLTRKESDDIFVHFMRMENVGNGARYLATAKPPEKPTREDVSFNFVASNMMTPETTTEIDFKLTQSLMLEGIAFAQPRFRSTSIFMSYVVTIEVQRMGITLLKFNSKTVDAECARFTFPKAVFVESDQVYKVKVTMPPADALNRFYSWKKSHSIQRMKWNDIEFLPMNKNVSTVYSMISKFYFHKCNKEELKMLFGDRLNFHK